MTAGQVRVAAVLAAALVLALGLWLLLAHNDKSPRSARVPSPSATAGQRLSEGGLIDHAHASGAHVYWVGPRDGVGYEFTVTQTGRAFVRYLPRGVTPGDPRPNFLTVATYPLSTGVSALRRAGQKSGTQLVQLPRGALVYTSRQRPTSAYLARPGWDYQVEVYDPKPGEAMRLVLAGDVKQVP
jgi:hypothetical protein